MSILYKLIPAFGTLQVIMLAVLCVIATFLLTRRPKNLPPGPTPLPIVGNIFSVMMDAGHQAKLYMNWSKKYGDVITVFYGPKPAIVLTSYAAIHEALVKNADIFSSRPLSSVSATPDGKTRGILKEPYGPTFKEHRRFAVMGLRDYGLGKTSLEGKIVEEARLLCEVIYQTDSHAFCISHLLQNAVANVIYSIIFGNRCDYDDTKFTELLTTISQVFSTSIIQMLSCLIPPLRLFPSVRKGYREFRTSQAKIMEHVKERIMQHEETFDPKDIRDYIDAFLLESKKRNSDDNSTFTEQQLSTIVYQLFLAGTDVTSTTLHWALLYMILHPDIQDRVQQEIDNVLGPDQEPSMVHRSQMPYTEATLTEVSRLATIAPFTLTHSTSKDATFRGYNIPMDTPVTVNLWAVHHDPQLWPEPSKFDPARFLGDTGNFVRRNEFIPFSMGRRVCLGEQLARMELFLIFTSLLQRFTFKLPEGAPKPSEKGVYGVVHSPAPFKLIAEPRN